MAQPKKTLYDILGVPRDASTQDIAAAYERRKAALEESPSADPNEAIVLRQAYDVLRDPKRRAAHDAALAGAAQRAAAEPRIVIEPGDEPSERKLPWIPIAAGVVLLGAVLFLVLRPSRTPPPAPVAEAPAAAPATEAPKPAPLRERSGAEVMADAFTSGGPLLSYSMSGQSTPVGIATSTEQGMMVTTCHSVPAGTKLVVRVGAESYPADLLITDEMLDLCTLQVANFGAPPVKLASEEPKAGDKIFTVGVNAKGEPAVTQGTVKQILATTEGRLIELSMPIGQYSSGGGVFDRHGRLVGIATVQHKSGLSIALPAGSISEMRSRGPAK